MVSVVCVPPASATNNYAFKPFQTNAGIVPEICNDRSFNTF